MATEKASVHMQNSLSFPITKCKKEYEPVAVIVNYFIMWFGMVWLRIFQLAVKVAKILERICKTNWKVQASTPTTNKRRPNVDNTDS